MTKSIKYLLLVVAGLLIILLCSTIQQALPSIPGDYYFSSFLKNNYTVLTAIIFFITGLLTGYYLHLNPWVSGMCLVLVFYLTAIFESIVYKGSHNLIPFEFVIFFILALPAIIGVYVGQMLLNWHKKKTNSARNKSS